MQDADGSIPFFWGVDYENHLVFSDDVGILKTGCGNSYAPFPKGNYYNRTTFPYSFFVPDHLLTIVRTCPPLRLLLHHLRWAAELRAPVARGQSGATRGQPRPDVRLHLQGRQREQEEAGR
jgi:hypothetical protein